MLERANLSPFRSLVCISNCDKIFADPLNRSTTKQLYSFSKASRFDHIHHYRKPYNDNIYETNTSFKSAKKLGKSGGFGSAPRPELFSQKEKNKKPPPDTYTLKSSFKQLFYPGMA